MGGLETRIGRLEAGMGRRRRPGISGERRKALTDFAVLHGDPAALLELSRYRPAFTVGKERRAAAFAAGLRADI